MEYKGLLTFATKYDNNPSEDFPIEYSAWVAGAPYFKKVGGSDELSIQTVEVTPRTRTVVSDGFVGPVYSRLVVAPPKYPPIRIEKRCVSNISVAAAVHGDPQYFSLAFDPAEGVVTPPALQDRGSYDPIPEAAWEAFLDALVAVTRSLIGNDQADLVRAAGEDWWTSPPPVSGGWDVRSPEAFILALRRYTG